MVQKPERPHLGPPQRYRDTLRRLLVATDDRRRFVSTAQDSRGDKQCRIRRKLRIPPAKRRDPAAAVARRTGRSQQRQTRLRSCLLRQAAGC
jgi:hypothetical protein